MGGLFTGGLQPLGCAADRDCIRAGYAQRRGSDSLSGEAASAHSVFGGLRLQAAGRVHACGCESVCAGSGDEAVWYQDGDEESELL